MERQIIKWVGIIVFSILLIGILDGAIKLYYQKSNEEFEIQMKQYDSDFTVDTSVTHKTIQKDGYDLHYFVSGNPEGEAIVFVHQAFGDHTVFDRQIDYFASRYRIITFDMLGHGLTRIEKSKDKIAVTSSHIAELLDAEQIQKAHLVGVSLGALFVQDFALQCPHRILSVTGVGGYNIHKEQKEIAKVQRKELFKWLFKLYLSKDTFRRYIAEISVKDKAAQAHIYKSAEHITGKTFRAMWGMDHLVSYRPNVTYPYPLLVLVGDGDIPAAIASAKQWHKDVPSSKFTMIEQAGHCAHIDNYERFNRTLMNFLEEVEPSPSH